MIRTLLFVGTDEATRIHLAFVPGRVVRTDTIPEANQYLKAADRSEAYLVAFGPDIARRSRPGVTGYWRPLADGGRPVIVLTATVDNNDPLWAGAVALGVTQVVCLPGGWPWLLDTLAGTRTPPTLISPI